MITVNRIYEVNQAILVDTFSGFTIPYLFTQNQKNLIITIFNSSSINQNFMGTIIPYSTYDLNGKLEYFRQSVYSGNTYLNINSFGNFYLMFKPRYNGNYFITIDEIEGITTNEETTQINLDNSLKDLQKIIDDLSVSCTNNANSQTQTIENYDPPIIKLIL